MRVILYGFLTFLVINPSSAQKTGPPHTDEPVVEPQEEVHSSLEHMPVFPGGDIGLMKFLKDHVKYPEEERRNKIQGTVLVRFVIEKNGSADNPEIAHGINAALNAEAIKVIKLLPKFQPGTWRGKPAAVYYTVPVVFSLN